MSDFGFQWAKFLNTIGFKHYAKNIWDSAENDSKLARWGSSNFQSTFINDRGVLNNNLTPKKEVIESLAEEQVWHRAAQFFNVFGFTSLRGFLQTDKIKKIDSILNIKANAAVNKTLYSSPVENSREIQEILIQAPIFDLVSKIIGPFWYFASDAAVGTKSFPLHRDTFFNPPMYKIFIPTQPGIFQVLCGSQFAFDEFSKNAGSYICDWDKPNNLGHGSSSLYFQSNDSHRKIVGYDDSQKNPPLTNIPLNAGDVFVFNQNLVHGLRPVNETTSFVAISAFPSPENSKKFNMTREEHLESIIKSTASIILVEKDLSSSKKLDSSEITLPGQAFKESELLFYNNDPQMKKYFGFSKISSDAWDDAFKKVFNFRWEILRNTL